MQKRYWWLSVLLCMLAYTASSFATPPAAIDKAWDYVSAKKKADRWVVISSPNKGGYFQCANENYVVICEIPLWSKVIPSSHKTIKQVNFSDRPHAEIEGAILKKYLIAEEICVIESVLKKHQIEYERVYYQAQNQQHAIVGTLADIRFVLEFDYQHFSTLATDYLQTVFGITARDGYRIETDSN